MPQLAEPLTTEGATVAPLDAYEVQVLAEQRSLVESVGKAPTREQIERLESHLLEFPQVDVPVDHFFADGMYAREVRIPKGLIATGKVHRFEHVSIMVSGDMSVLTEDGSIRRVTGYNVFIAPAGTKRVGVAHQDTVWLTVHTNPTNERDPERVVAELVEPWTPLRLSESATPLTLEG